MQGIAQKVMAEPGKYSLQQLQQAVQSGSLPAYIGIPLIQEKIKQQKQMQGAEQAQAPQGPSIAEQVMQEAQGVQALPTNLPEQYAGGGIVAFEEGGEVERYQSRGLVGETPEERRRREYLATPEGRAAQIRADRASLMAPFAATADVFAAPFNSFNAVLEGTANAIGVPRLGRALGIYDPDVTSVAIPRVGGPGATPFYDKLRAYAAGQQPSAATSATSPFRITDTSDASSVLGGAASSPGINTFLRGAPTTAPTANRAAADRATAGPAPATKPTFTAPPGDTYKKTAEDFFSDYATRARNADVEAEAKKKEIRGRLQGEAFDDYKKSLEDEAKAAGAERGQARSMALFKAGLAMMAGTSQHALENIGKGALLGAEDYQAAVKDLRKAERERRKEFAHIEQARRAEKIGDRDTAVREIDAARDRHNDRVRFVGEGIYKATGMDKAQAFKVAETQFAADTDIFKTERAGQYTVEAARVRAANAGAGRGALTQGQLLNARMQAMKLVDENQIRNQVAAQLNFKKVPKPGADAQFDARVATAYDQAINTMISRAQGVSGAPGGGGNPYQNYRIVEE
jgi:hypothetical protein